MHAYIIRSHGGLEAMEYVKDWPEPVPAESEVVVKVEATALNYHDLFTLKGMPGIKVPMPLIMGIDVAGTIAAIGPNCGEWQVGDRVLVDPLNRRRYKLLGEMMDGGLADYCKVEASQLVRLPEAVSFREAAALPVAYGTAYRMMVTRAGLHPNGTSKGKTVFILGASGGVGSCCVQLAKLSGATTIAAASSDEKLTKLKLMGADVGINYRTRDFKDSLHELYGKPRIWGENGIDLVVNFTGGDTWVQSLQIIKKGGTIVTCGATAGYASQTDLRYVWTFELNILGSNGWQRSDLADLLTLVEAGRLKPWIDRVIPLKEAPEAFRALQSREVVGKIIIEP